MDLVLATGRPPGAGGRTAVPLRDRAAQSKLSARERYADAMQRAYEAQLSADFKTAKAQFQQARQYQPRSRRPIEELGRIYVEVDHDMKSAERLYRQYMELHPKYARAELLYGWLIDAHKNDFKVAERFYLRASYLSPRWTEPVSRLAKLNLHAKKYAVAEKLFLHAIKMKPGSGKEHADLAFYYLRRNRTQDARKEAHRASKLGYSGPHPAFIRLGLKF